MDCDGSWTSTSFYQTSTTNYSSIFASSDASDQPIANMSGYSSQNNGRFQYLPNIKIQFEGCTPDAMPTVDVSNASQPNVCWNTPIEEMDVDASDDVTFEPALNTLDLSYNTSTHIITGTPNFTGTRTVIVTVTSDDGCLKAKKELTITVNKLEATIEFGD